MRSKEEAVLELLFNNPKHWHFEELRRTAGISRPQLAQWLRKFQREGIIRRVKEKGKMPYYVQDFENPGFRQRKKLFALRMLTDSGLLAHLAGLDGAKAVILFGSFTRPDWYYGSDIDVFIYGREDEFEQGRYERKLGREIQVHGARTKRDLRKMGRMLPSIITGNFIKGTIDDLGVEVHAHA